MTDRTAIIAEADALEQTAADLMARASRLRAIAGAALAAPMRPVAGITWPPPLDTIVLTDGCWMSIGQAATFICKSECTIRRHRHEIGVKIGGTWWINRQRLVAYFAAKAQ